MPTGADSFIPQGGDLDDLREAATHCQGCDLWKNTTQVVFGEGPSTAPLMLVGEQPGDQEDRQGHVFVGPAGHVLDRALAEAGIDRRDVFLTNAVKHFRWKPAPRGKRRLHQRPSRSETVACHPWLAAEASIVQPRLVVCLGALAAESLIGPGWRIGEHRGQIVDSNVGPPALATLHPSAVLRAPEGTDRDVLLAELVEDLSTARQTVAG